MCSAAGDRSISPTHHSIDKKFGDCKIDTTLAAPLQAASELYGRAVKALEAEGKAGMSSDVFRSACCDIVVFSFHGHCAVLYEAGGV